MLCQFKVRNFRTFEHWFTLNLTDTKEYQFNPQCIENQTVTTALIYGPNGCGKSNLGHAIFDIKTHLTDEKTAPTYFSNYLHAKNSSDMAEFVYSFKFGEFKVEYTYGKETVDKFVYERVTIDGEEVVSLDRRNGNTKAVVNLPGSETLNRDLGDKGISVVKYVENNTVFLDRDRTAKGPIFNLLSKFVKFMTLDLAVEESANMAMCDPETFYSMIAETHSANVTGVARFSKFLNEVGIDCPLTTVKAAGKHRVAFDFGENKVEFAQIASHGTLTLADIYMRINRLKRMEEFMGHYGYDEDAKLRQFIFVDEFDAFYHHAVSKDIVKKLRDIKAQVILTSHNTSIMTNDLLRPDCYFIMGESDIKPIHQFTAKELRVAHNLEKMYKAGAFSNA